MDTFHIFFNVVSLVAAHAASGTPLIDAVSNTEPIRHFRGKATHSQAWTIKGAGGDDVVVDGRGNLVCVQVMQCLAI